MLYFVFAEGLFQKFNRSKKLNLFKSIAKESTLENLKSAFELGACCNDKKVNTDHLYIRQIFGVPGGCDSEDIIKIVKKTATKNGKQEMISWCINKLGSPPLYRYVSCC